MQANWRTKLWLYALAAVFVSFQAPQARAQTFPDRPVHLIVGVSPGGGVDNTARTLAQHLSALWGQPVIVEDRPGAAGAIAFEYVAKAPADGYTLLVSSDDITALSALRGPALPYNLLRDLIPVSLIATAPMVLVVNPLLPAHNVRELIALAQSEPGKITYGSPGIGSITHLQAARFAMMANMNIAHVPYKGTSAAVVGVADGEIDMTFAAPPSVQGLAKAGKLRVLAISGRNRSSLVPGTPTIIETGGPQFIYTASFGMFAPAGLPKDVMATLSAAIAKAANSPGMKATLAKQGEEAQANSPAQFAAFVRGELEELTDVVKAAGIKAK